ncbi:unnamed protein product [Linum trigynum]|uniref:Uncharacterized protein n=1 Tax=Linum trigynum TaxID=586398 RepID=A0AAV2GS30_9ROSI
MNHIVFSKLACLRRRSCSQIAPPPYMDGWELFRPDGFSEYATLWMDELGVLVQGLASKHLSDQLKEVLSIGKIYFITQFSQREAKKRRGRR